MERGSFGRSAVSGIVAPVWFPGSDAGATGLMVGNGTITSGLLEGELSSLLGGVLNGDTEASKEGRRCSGLIALPPAIPTGRAIVVGFAGIFGFSARLTGGGLAGDLGIDGSFVFCSIPPVSKVTWCSGLAARGVCGLEEVRLEC
jgi:hypothetical protein